MSRLIRLRELNTLDFAEDSVAVFGGTFDPFHAGHLSVIKLLIPIFSRIVIAPTDQNPWKTDPQANLEQRLAMIRLILQAEQIPVIPLGDLTTSGVRLADTPYTFVSDALVKFREYFGAEIFWIVGEDSVESVKKWKDWETLNLTVVAAPISIDVHATEMREGKTALHRAIDGYTRKHGLYGRPLSS